MSRLSKSMKKVPARVRALAKDVLERIEGGATVREIGGRRLSHDRSRVSVSLGRSWRLLVDASGDKLVPQAVMSHEAYSRGAKCGKR